MKTVITLGMFALGLFGTHASYANEVEDPVEVTSQEFKILGRGVENRETGETLAMACITETCSVIRPLYIPADHMKAYLVGSTVVINMTNTAPTKKEIKETLRKLSREFREQRSKHEPEHFALVKMVGIYGGTALVTVAASTVLTGFVGLPLGFAAAYLLAQPMFGDQNMRIASFNDRDGWNWSSRPKKISARAFSILLESRNAAAVQ